MKMLRGSGSLNPAANRRLQLLDVFYLRHSLKGLFEQRILRLKHVWKSFLSIISFDKRRLMHREIKRFVQSHSAIHARSRLKSSFQLSIFGWDTLCPQYLRQFLAIEFILYSSFQPIINLVFCSLCVICQDCYFLTLQASLLTLEEKKTTHTGYPYSWLWGGHWQWPTILYQHSSLGVLQVVRPSLQVSAGLC